VIAAAQSLNHVKWFFEHSLKVFKRVNGEGGIRTHGPFGTSDFKSDAIDHSATSPGFAIVEHPSLFRDPSEPDIHEITRPPPCQHETDCLKKTGCWASLFIYAIQGEPAVKQLLINKRLKPLVWRSLQRTSINLPIVSSIFTISRQTSLRRTW
jgi:hypothetical protein